MAIYFLTQDLIFFSRVAGTIREQGVDVRGLRWVDELAGAMESGELELVLVDLSAPDMDVQAVVDAVRENSYGETPVVAYAPHVHEARLDAARQAGCTEVLTRGQFNKQIDGLVEKYCS